MSYDVKITDTTTGETVTSTMPGECTDNERWYWEYGGGAFEHKRGELFAEAKGTPEFEGLGCEPADDNTRRFTVELPTAGPTPPEYFP